MNANELHLARAVAALQQLPIAELRRRYAEAFGEATHAANRDWLVKRIAWRLQAAAEGDLSERARQRAAALANDADLRLAPPKVRQPEAAGQPATPAARRAADDRQPPPGSVLTRAYKGQVLHVTVLEQGFAFAGRVYPSLSAVAKHITGSHCNGFLFFKLTQGGDQ